MSDIDFKTIGLAAKDILLGIGTVAAGATGGPAAAEGVGKAGAGLDRILSTAGVTETRADKFDRADFAARPQAQAQQQISPQSPPPQLPAPPPPAAAQAPEPARMIAEEVPASSLPPQGGPLIGDARIAAEHLRSLGWSRHKVQQILGGPEQASLAAIVSRETKGVRVKPGADGVRVAQVDGVAVPVRAGRSVPVVDGQALPTVGGTRVKDV